MLRVLRDADERSTGASKRLSERYGIPESEVSSLLYGKTSAANESVPLPKFRGETSMPNTEKNSSWNPVSILGALLGVIGVLSLVVAIIVLQRHNGPDMPFGFHHEMSSQMSRPMPPEAIMPPESPMMKDSCCMTPDEKGMNSPTSAAPETQEPQPTQKKTQRTTKSAPKGFTTSNAMEAEEHLADLRAEGNSKAKIRTSTKNGVTTYSVR